MAIEASETNSNSGSLAAKVINTYTTFSGIDITAIFDNLILATLSGIATSLTREKVPVFTVGSANARSISRGKRACAGSIQFTLFDRDAFYSLFMDSNHYYYAHADEVNSHTNPVNISEYTGLFFDANEAFDGYEGITQEGAALTGPGFGGGNITLNPENANPGTSPVIGVESTPDAGKVGALAVRRAAQHADQVYPFDITLIAQNEYGRASTCAIIGVEIINEGGGISVDDITNEQQMTYIAITKLPWIPMTGDTPRETLLGRAQSLTPNAQDATTVDLYATGGSFAAPGGAVPAQ